MSCGVIDTPMLANHHCPCLPSCARSKEDVFSLAWTHVLLHQPVSCWACQEHHHQQLVPGACAPNLSPSPMPLGREAWLLALSVDDSPIMVVETVFNNVSCKAQQR